MDKAIIDFFREFAKVWGELQAEAKKRQQQQPPPPTLLSATDVLRAYLLFLHKQLHIPPEALQKFVECYTNEKAKENQFFEVGTKDILGGIYEDLLLTEKAKNKA